MIMKGPKGICEERFFLFLTKSGTALTSAIADEKNIIKGIDTQPNQKPIAESNLASPNPIPYFFLICL